MFFKGGTQFFGVRGFCHLRERGQNVLFSVVDVLERLVTKIMELFRGSCHYRLLVSRNACRLVFGLALPRRDNAARFAWFRRGLEVNQKGRPVAALFTVRLTDAPQARTSWRWKMT